MFLEEYETKINEIIEQQGLQSLDDACFGSKNVLQLFSEIEKTRAQVNKEGVFDFMKDDLIFSVSPALKFSIANLYLYNPYTNKLNEEFKVVGNTELPTYLVTTGEKRYLYYLNITFEKLYNYWDRIGDLLNLCFDLKIPEREVYFARAIEELGKKDIKDEAFYWFKVFKENDYSNYINRIRRRIVHYRQKETYFLVEFLNSVGKEDCRGRIDKLQIEKDSYLRLLTDQLKIANQGFEKMIELIKRHGGFEE